MEVVKFMVPITGLLTRECYPYNRKLDFFKYKLLIQNFPCSERLGSNFRYLRTCLNEVILTLQTVSIKFLFVSLNIKLRLTSSHVILENVFQGLHGSVYLVHIYIAREREREVENGGLGVLGSCREVRVHTCGRDREYNS